MIKCEMIELTEQEIVEVNGGWVAYVILGGIAIAMGIGVYVGWNEAKNSSPNTSVTGSVYGR